MEEKKTNEVLTKECKDLMKKIEDEFKKDNPNWAGIGEPEDWDKQTDPKRY